MLEKKFCHYCATPLVNKHVEGRVRRFCPACNTPVYENPVPASCAVVINSCDEVLLVKRSVEPKVGMWCLPGGFIELDESPSEACLRELREETGLNGKIDQLLGVTTHNNAQYFSVLITGYLIKNFNGDLYPGDDASDASFFPFESLPEIAFKTHLAFIRTYFSAFTPSNF